MFSVMCKMLLHNPSLTTKPLNILNFMLHHVNHTHKLMNIYNPKPKTLTKCFENSKHTNIRNSVTHWL